MSYCRWSSDDFQCDIYAYEHVMGVFVTHAAGNRIIFAEPIPPEVPFEKEFLHEYLARHQKVMKMVEAATREKIGLPHDGEVFYDPDAAACADRLEYLRSLGYRVPQYAIDALREESDYGDCA